MAGAWVPRAGLGARDRVRWRGLPAFPDAGAAFTVRSSRPRGGGTPGDQQSAPDGTTDPEDTRLCEPSAGPSPLFARTFAMRKICAATAASPAPSPLLRCGSQRCHRWNGPAPGSVVPRTDRAAAYVGPCRGNGDARRAGMSRHFTVVRTGEWAAAGRAVPHSSLGERGACPRSVAHRVRTACRGTPAERVRFL